MTTGERPGVYASYEVTGVSYSGTAAGTVGVAAKSVSGTAGTKYTISSYAQAVSTFGAAADITAIIKVLIKNGVSTVIACPLIASGGTVPVSSYETAFTALASDEKVKIIICDSKDSQVIAKMEYAIEHADDRAKHKIGIIEGTGTVATDTASAATVNSERIVLVSPTVYNEGGTAAGTGILSAAMAGAILAESDPAIPLNGAELAGIGGTVKDFTDSEITTLVRGGVTPIECVGGKVTVVRGITTRTTTAGVSDATFRELTTTLIIDDVVPTVRRALTASFARSKNTAQTRGAVRTRVMLELERKVAAEIIDSYDNVTVAVNQSDPTVCDVSFEFTVAHGLNQIRLTAYITV